LCVHRVGELYNESVEADHVYCVSNRYDELLNMLMKHKIKPGGVLFLVGQDTYLSETINHLEPIKHKFSKIYTEGKDIPCDWVHGIPMGTNIVYLLRCGGNRILNLINSTPKKTKLIGTAFGDMWPHLNEDIIDRQNLLTAISNHDVIEPFFCKPDVYFNNLSQYYFFASPIGNGIQTPKICESIMCKTLPIVTPHPLHREFKNKYKVPLIIVKHWSDITKTFLEDQMEYYNNIDWDDQMQRFLVKNFLELYT
jgi:hypothetical protein